MIRTIAILILSCAINYTSSAQDFRILHWGIEHGLSQGINQKIIQDKQGFIWATSYEGVNRFDGKIFQNFYSSPRKRNSIKGTETIGLVVDSLGKVWIGSGEGLNRYDPVIDSVISFDLRKPVQGKIKYIVPICATKDEVICLDINNELVGYNSKTFSRRLITSGIHWFNDYSNTNNSLLQLETKTLWMPIESGLARIDLVNGKSDFFWKDQQIIAINSLEKGSLLLGTKEGLIKWNTTNNQSEHLRKIKATRLGKVTCITTDDSGYWLGTEENGLFRMNIDGTSVHLSKSSEELNSINGNKINTVYTDHEGVVWISVGTNGIDQLIPGHPFRHYSENPASKNSLSNNIVRCFMEDAENNVWIATQGGGINIFNPSLQTFSAFTVKNLPGLPYNLVRYLVRENKNFGLVGTEKGMCRVNLLQKKAERIDFVDSSGRPLTSPYVEQIIPFGDTAWIVATKEFGLCMLKKDGRICKQLPFPGNKHVFYTNLVNDLLFVSIWDDEPRVFRIHENKWIEIYPEFTTYLTTYVLYDSVKRKYWIGTLKGLLEVNEKLEIDRQYTTADGLSNHYIYALVLDKGGLLWISTNKGICSFDTHTKTFTQYSPADGLQGYEYNAKAGLLASDGKVYFGGINGFDVINTSIKTNIKENARLYIRQLRINNIPYAGKENINYTSQIQLPHSGNNITIHTGVIGFAKQANQQIRYKLEGADDDWKIAERDFVINYSGLTPGHYRFIGSSIDQSPYEKEEVVLSIIIAKPWWQSWWFLSVIGLAFVTMVVLVIRFYYHRKLEKQRMLFEKQKAIDQERTRIAMEMHDDLGSGLTRIRYLAGALPSNSPEATKEKAQKIESSAKVLVDNMNDIIWTMKSDNNSLDEALAYIRKQAAEQLETAGIHYQIDFPKVLPTIKLTNELKRNLLLIAKEAIHNIVKHSAATQVTLSAKLQNRQLELKIMDNGKGIDLTAFNTFGNGLKSMRKRAEEIKGLLEVMNAQGTTIMVTAQI